MKRHDFKTGLLIQIDPEEIEWIGYLQGKGKLNALETIKAAYARIRRNGRPPDILINAELFNRNGTPASDVVCRGTAHRLTENFGVAFPGNKKAAWSYKNSVNAPDYLSFYPYLVKDYKVDLSAYSAIAGISGYHARTALGITPSGGVLVALLPQPATATLPELATSLVNAGAQYGGNFDGGGSTQYVTPWGAYSSGRAVRGFLGIWLTDKARNALPYTATATVRTNVCTSTGNVERGRYIDKGDTIIIHRELTENLLAKIEYPLAKGGWRTAYVKEFGNFKKGVGW